MAEEKYYTSEIISELAQSLSNYQPDNIKSYEEFCDQINHLIANDFHTLVNILYRMDVSETRIAEALAGYPGTDAAEIIAGLMIERQLEKIETRNQFNSSCDISDEEKW